MLTVSFVSCAVANPEQKETFWSKTKKFFAPVKYESAEKKKELLDLFPTDKVLKLFPVEPLYGQKSSHGATSNTFWFSFVKLPLEVCIS